MYKRQVKILPRKNSLIRPAVANVDQAFVIFAMDDPKPNFMLLDRFLIMMEQAGVPAVVCFNKKDLAEEKEIRELYDTYAEMCIRDSNHPFKLESIDEYIPDELKSETTALGYLQLLPGVHGTDGFFIARFRRK